MSNILRKVVEERRKTLINKLLTFNGLEEKEELMKLSLTELEEEFQRVLADSHPHSYMGSIRWKNKSYY